MKHFSLFFLLALLGLVPSRAQTLTALQAGDIALLGQNATGADDFAFAALVDLAPGTQVKLTDNGWQPGGGFASSNEGVCVYTAPAGDNPLHLDTSTLPNGLYYLQVVQDAIVLDRQTLIVE